jgi:hypothetical protein
VYDVTVGRLSIILLLCGCRQILGFETVASHADAGDDAPALADANVPDAAPCTAIESECVAPTVLRTCSTVGEVPVDTACAWGCSVAGANDAHCAVLQPAGGAVQPADLMPGAAALADVTITTDTTTVIDTVTGTITGVRPSGLGVMNGIDFEVRNNVGIFRMSSLVVDGGGAIPLQIHGTNALALVAIGDITIRAPLDATVDCSSATAVAVVGGFKGGTNGSDGSGLGGGKRGQGPGDKTGGGGGGGFVDTGGAGGAGAQGPGGNGGTPYGDAAITTLIGGSGGGGVNGGGANVAGGSGGGAIQIASNGTIRFDSGGINAGGCGGRGPNGGGGGAGGGGAGGAILLEAPIVSAAASTFFAANGGGGGGDNKAEPGEAGKPSSATAHGVIGATGGNGGNGGANATLAGGPGTPGMTAGGGGGGACGRIRIDTLSAATLQLSTNAIVSPAIGTGAATTALAIVQ